MKPYCINYVDYGWKHFKMNDLKCLLHCLSYSFTKILIYNYAWIIFAFRVIFKNFQKSLLFWGAWLIVGTHIQPSCWLPAPRVTCRATCWISTPMGDWIASIVDCSAPTCYRILALFFISVTNRSFPFTATKNSFFEPILYVFNPFLPLFLSFSLFRAFYSTL